MNPSAGPGNATGESPAARTNGASDVPPGSRDAQVPRPGTSAAGELIVDGIRAMRLGALDRALDYFATAAAVSEDASQRSEALTQQSYAHRVRSEWDAAVDVARRAQRIARGSRLEHRLTDALIAEGNVLLCRGDFAAALAIFRSVLDETRDHRTRGIALQNIGTIHAQQGRFGTAERAFAESYGCFQRAGYRRGEAIALNNHGRVALDRGDAELAGRLLAAALDLALAVEDGELTALVRVNLSEVRAARGDFQGAEELASTALGHFCSCGNRWRQVECLRLLGQYSARCGCAPDAVRCYERALAIAQEIGAMAEVGILRECLRGLGKG